jgi:hypothetical protein
VIRVLDTNPLSSLIKLPPCDLFGLGELEAYLDIHNLSLKVPLPQISPCRFQRQVIFSKGIIKGASRSVGSNVLVLGFHSNSPFSAAWC